MTNLFIVESQTVAWSLAQAGNFYPPSESSPPGDSSDYAQCQAVADPMVEIDPSYQYANFFKLSYGQSIYFNPPNPMVLRLTKLTAQSAEFLLTCPSNNVYAIQANSDLTTTNWTPLAVMTNLAGSAVSYTDADVASNPQRFYRAAALRKVQ